jgi:hypothetical protein
MSYAIADPELIKSAATGLAAIGANLSAAHTSAAPPTLAVVPAAADEVSAGIAQLFSQYGQTYHAMAAQAAAFDERFVQHLTASAVSFAGAEASNAALLQNLAGSAASFINPAATLQGEIVNFFASVNAALGQLLNSLGGFLNALTLDALAFSALLTQFFFIYVLPVVILALNVLVLF